MMHDRDIVCFANDWHTDPTSKHHLMRRFSATNRVLWIEAAGMRRPNLSSRADLLRIVGKARKFFKPATAVLPNLRTYTPPSIPLPGLSWARRLNTMLYRASIGREAAGAGMSPTPVLWVYGPHVAPFIRGMPRSALVYHCVDKWSAFEGYGAAFMDACEQELCEAADLVVASAEDLADRCRRFSDNVHYIPHGVDHEHFAAALAPGELPPELSGSTMPRVGFFGLIHEWVDLELIGRLADAVPFEFVLIGASNQPMDELTRRPNVRYLGRQPFHRLPDFCRAFSAAIVPFRMSELTISVNPIKLREYAAAGLPIVSTGLPEVLKCTDIARIASTPEEWIRELRLAVTDGESEHWRRAQSARVKRDDWDGVAGRIGDLLERALR
jgi:glycosyltransferase involved in cell wall biosynthesis